MNVEVNVVRSLCGDIRLHGYAQCDSSNSVTIQLQAWRNLMAALADEHFNPTLDLSNW